MGDLLSIETSQDQAVGAAKVLGPVKVSVEEVMRTCGGAVAGVDEQVRHGVHSGHAGVSHPPDLSGALGDDSNQLRDHLIMALVC